MGQALYRRYRPKKLRDVVGQEHITQTLSNALVSGTVRHAYLFTGPRGVGKTSVARILAHEINGFTYNEDSTHMDIIEIDAASNRRIDEIRDLRDKVHIAPVAGKYKVYIIDEVHMLTREAFNALLKTLEEPPAHAVFILATTEVHKVPDTIQSRSQRFTFKGASEDVLASHLKFVAGQEGITISDDALETLAKHGGGSFRDALTILDQVSSVNPIINQDDVQALLGIPNIAMIDTAIDAIRSRTPALVPSFIADLRAHGIQPSAAAKMLADRVRRDLLEKQSVISSAEAISFLQDMLAVPTAHDQYASLELALLTLTLNPEPIQGTDNVPAKKMPEPTEQHNDKPQPQSKPAPKDKPVLAEAHKRPLAATTPTTSVTAKVTKSWADVLANAKKSHSTLHSMLRLAVASEDEEAALVRIGFSFPFHIKQISQPKNLGMVSEIVQAVYGQNYTIEIIKAEPAEPLAPTPHTPKHEQPADGTIEAISNIFGNAELLES